MEAATDAAELIDDRTLATLDEETGHEVDALTKRAQAMEITSPEAADAVAEFRNEIVSRRKRIEEWFRSPIDLAFKAHRALTQRRSDAVARFAEPERIAVEKLKAWNEEQTRLRREAEQIAERERQRLMEEQRLADAIEAEKAGDAERAERIVEGRTPQPVPHVPVAVAPPQKVAGVSFVKGWGYRIVDAKKLLREYLMPDERRIAGVIKSLGDAAVIPGVEVFETSSVRTAPGARR